MDRLEQVKKALTVKQPWASLIVAGIKDIENRTWATKYRGPLLIHASGKPWTWGMIQQYLTVDMDYAIDKAINSNELDRFTPNWLRSLPTSAIIGQVDIVDCIINHPSVWADKSHIDPYDTLEADNIIYNWVLANPVQFDEPILNVKGKLSLWEWEGKI